MSFFTFTEKFNVLWRQNWTEAAGKVVREFEDKIIYKVQNSGYKGDNDKDLWSFPGALLYSITVFTTIGKSKCTTFRHIQKVEDPLCF